MTLFHVRHRLISFTSIMLHWCFRSKHLKTKFEITLKQEVSPFLLFLSDLLLPASVNLVSRHMHWWLCRSVTHCRPCQTECYLEESSSESMLVGVHKKLTPENMWNVLSVCAEKHILNNVSEEHTMYWSGVIWRGAFIIWPNDFESQAETNSPPNPYL